MSVTDYSVHSQIFADARQLLEFASASLLWQMALFLNSTYFDGKISAVGLRVVREDDEIYVSKLVSVDAENNVLTSKILDRAECALIFANNFPLLAKNEPSYEGEEDLLNNPEDINNALSFVNKLLAKHYEILRQIFFDQCGGHVIVLAESLNTVVLENTLLFYNEQKQQSTNKPSLYDLNRRMKCVPFLNDKLFT